MFSDDRCREVILRSLAVGDEKAAGEFGLKLESLSRMKRRFKKIAPGIIENIDNLNKIQTTFSDKELSAITQSSKVRPVDYRSETIDFTGEKLKYMQITDTHIGHIMSDEELIRSAMKLAVDEGCEFIIHTGDVTEGMSNRPGHVYELQHIGYKAQMDAACEIFKDSELPIYAIDGNHDRWYIKACGAYIVEDISKELEQFNYLGCDFATLKAGGVDIGLWHGEDGNSYALSYRMQKIVEAMTESQLPQILHAGHTHKYVTCNVRNIPTVSGGTGCGQTNWMRGKRIEAHVGFVIEELTIQNGNIIRNNTEFIKGE